MKLTGPKVQTESTPLQVSGGLNLTGGSAVQFFDGVEYSPNREGTPASPILLTHTVSIINPDEATTGAITINPSTTFYENEEVISASTAGYTLVGNNALRVGKNILAGTSVVIRAKTQFVDPRNGKAYEREDSITLRTIIKAPAQFQLDLSQRGRIFFDGYRNPNTKTTVTATLRQGSTPITDHTGIILKWLNAEGLDVIENELFADSVSADGKTLTVDKTYIDHETIKCEAWRGSELLGSDTVTFIRKFNSIRCDVRIPELPLLAGVNRLTCSVLINDMLGNIDVNTAFLVTWMANENGSLKTLGTGTPLTVSKSAINLSSNNVSIYPDIKRREAFAALTTDEDELLTDDDDNIITVETYGK